MTDNELITLHQALEKLQEVVAQLPKQARAESLIILMARARDVGMRTSDIQRCVEQSYHRSARIQALQPSFRGFRVEPSN